MCKTSFQPFHLAASSFTPCRALLRLHSHHTEQLNLRWTFYPHILEHHLAGTAIPPLCMSTPPHGCHSSERVAALQNERVLFHYNGHGVPRPTANGEIWVFNKAYTQYIPLSIYDLQAWVGSPCIYVFDCSAAGMVVTSYRHFAEQRAKVH